MALTEGVRVALEARLGDADHQVRCAALRSIGWLRIGEKGTLDILTRIRQTDPVPDVGYSAAEAILGITGQPPAPLRDLEDMLTDFRSRDANEREIAINEIGLMGIGGDPRVKDQRVLEALADRLVDDDQYLNRQMAALALQRIGAAPAFVVDALIRALDDRILLVQVHAASTLGSFGAAASLALPRLRQVASGSGPMAERASRAIEKIGSER